MVGAVFYLYVGRLYSIILDSKIYPVPLNFSPYNGGGKNRYMHKLIFHFHFLRKRQTTNIHYFGHFQTKIPSPMHLSIMEVQQQFDITLHTVDLIITLANSVCCASLTQL